MTEPAVYSIPAGVSFVDALARGIRDTVGTAPEALTRVHILLPNRRAARALALAFLRQGDGRPQLLPRMTPLGDLDEDALFLDEPADVGADALDLPPAITPLRRHLLLTRLVLAGPHSSMGHDQAARLARELARLLDQIETERLDPAGLARLVPETFARHWQKTLDFLSIVTRTWPQVLADEGAIDAADRRNRLLDAQARAWRERPPATPVYAAGSTGSIPATAQLLGVVARLPRGAVILPGLDLASEDADWPAIAADPCHPQHTMARLLDEIGVKRHQVRLWPGTDVAATAARTALIRRALKPAERVGTGASEPPPEPDSFAGLTRIDVRHPEDEARLVSLVLREALESPGRTAALVTADRALARRVGSALRRWGIEVDDSAGRSLAETPAGLFLRLVAAMVAEDLAPVPLLATLKHPLAGLGLATAACRTRVRMLERRVLRGPRPAPGIAGLEQAWAGVRDADPVPGRPREQRADERAIDDLIGRLRTAVSALSDIIRHGHAPLPDIVAAHVRVAEALAATETEPGAARLWAGDDGEAAADFVAELRQSAEPIGVMAAERYPALLEVLMEDRVVRPRFGRHPRIAIWGPLEARLQHADVMILGSLNEEVWPPRVEASPWMSRPMMQSFGLPLPERRIGLSAHDFAQACSAPRVWLTRAERRAGAPTVPARWLFRLDTVLHGTGWTDANASTRRRLVAWQERLDAPDAVRPAPPPEPRPPVAVRPRRLSVTQVETWMRDPYALYARHILGLAALEPIDADPSAADYGQVVHEALARFLETNADGLPEDALARLLALARDAFGPVLDRPTAGAFWWPRFQRIARWFLAEEEERRLGVVRSHVETRGSLTLAGPHGPFRLTAVADRIDQRHDGGLAIVDYKTGLLPRGLDVEAGFACQLPLEAAIAEAGGFEGIDAGPVGELEYWRLSGGEPAGERKPLKGDPRTRAGDARAGLAALIACFDAPETPYRSRPRPAFAPRFSDYDHLARVREWSAGEEPSE